MDELRGFTTESGMKFTWTAQQIEAYRAARAADTDERQAIEAADKVQQPGARAPAGGERLASAAEIYARRDAVYRAAAQAAAPAAAEALDALPAAATVYARREALREAAQRGGAR